MSFAEYPEAFVWTCDECGHEAWFKPRNFWACVDELKARRWGFTPPHSGDDWGHCCGRCRHEYQKTSIMDRHFRQTKGSKRLMTSALSEVATEGELPMRRSGRGSGGGIGMNKHVERRAPKVEPRPRAKSPGGVGQIGAMQGNHITSTVSTNYRGDPLERGRGYSPPVGPTDNVAAVGCGGGRKVYASGSQGTQGNVNPGNPRPNTYREALEQE